MSEIVIHLNKIESLFGLLTPEKKYTFGTFCAERQWLVYKKATTTKNYNDQILFREILNEIWDWLAEKKNRPENFTANCEEAIINKIEDDNDTFASDITVSFYNLIHSVESNEPDEVLQTIEHDLNAIHFLLQDFILNLSVSSENEILIDSHELTLNEINEQNYCLEMLLSSDFSVETVVLLRERATGKSIFGNYWFE